MEIDINEQLDEIVWGVSDVRGVQNTRLVHAILVEVCRYLEKQTGDDVLNEIIQFVHKPYDSDAVWSKGHLFGLIYHNFLQNIMHEIDPPDAPLNIQAELPCYIQENLQQAGIPHWEIYDIFTKGVNNVDLNKLWPIYHKNEHVIAEGYPILPD